MAEQDNQHQATVGHDKGDGQTVRLIVGLLVLLLIAAGVVAILNNHSTQNTAKVVSSNTPKLAYIQVSDTGFTPATLTVSKGTVVIWQAKGTTKSMVIASNPYPSDDDLKDLKSTQLGNGASYRYQFNITGTHKYHDDLNPTVNGTVIVQ